MTDRPDPDQLAELRRAANTTRARRTPRPTTTTEKETHR